MKGGETTEVKPKTEEKEGGVGKGGRDQAEAKERGGGRKERKGGKGEKRSCGMVIY